MSKLLVIIAIVCILLAAILSSLLPFYGDICSKNEYTGHIDCVSHPIAWVTLWKVGDFLNYYGAAITSISTAIIGYLTWTIWITSRDQLRHSEQVERAYVTVGHERPGLDIKENGWAWVTMRVTNFGRTPATVTDAVIKRVI